MGIVIDIILLGVLASNIYLGYRRGLINVVFKLLAMIVALIITLILFKPVSNFIIDKTQIANNIKQTIIDKGIVKEKDDEKSNKYLEKYVQDVAEDAKNNVIEEAADVISINIVNVIVAIIIFIIARILLIFAKVLVEAIADLPIIKQFNKAGGMLYGIISGLIIVYLVLAIVLFMVSINNLSVITDWINASIITRYFYNNNIILSIFSK